MVGNEAFKKVFFLQDLPDAVIDGIGSMATMETFQEGDVLFEQNQDLTMLYMVVNGKILLNSKSPTGNDLTLDEVVSGRSFGVSTLMGKTKSSFTAVAAEKSDVIVLSSDKLIEMFETDSHIGYEVMLRVVQLFKSRMDKHTKQFLHSLATHPEMAKFR